jgi:hypothetical protein
MPPTESNCLGSVTWREGSIFFTAILGRRLFLGSVAWRSPTSHIAIEINEWPEAFCEVGSAVPLMRQESRSPCGFWPSHAGTMRIEGPIGQLSKGQGPTYRKLVVLFCVIERQQLG